MGDLAASTTSLARQGRANKSLQTATTWYNAAANAGVAAAQFKLATAYFAGAGVARDPQQALQWYMRAANQGMPVAQHALALFLIGGAAGTADLVEGYKWLLLAERSGIPDSQAVREKLRTRSPKPIASAPRRWPTSSSRSPSGRSKRCRPSSRPPPSIR